MNNIIKTIHHKFGYKIRKILRGLGYDIIKFRPEKMGVYAYYDMSKFVKSNAPLLLDVGANQGQTIIRMQDVFKNCVIHAFEPSASTFDILKKNTEHLKKVHLWNYGLGATTDQMIFNENNLTDMSSFLELGDDGWGTINQRTSVNMLTIDEFCMAENIQKIDVLKLDTQGFELEILKGAETSILNQKIGMLYMEVTFIELYKELPTLSTLYDFAVDHGFELVSIYPLQYNRRNMAMGTDLLFKHKSYQQL